MSELLLDRHLLASNATTYDTAWGTYGWTPALAGARASRLEEEVPWGTRSARLERPPRLSGALHDVVARPNLDRLGRALLPVDGRLGFSLWGAVGEERVGSEWRVATHTILLDADAFRALAGYPDGLVRDRGAAAPESGAGAAAWLRELVEDRDLSRPAPLEPLRVEATPALRQRLTAARIDEVERLLGVALASRGGDRARLADELADVYEALAAAVAGRAVRHVAVSVGETTAGVSLLRLVWLSLPLEDRLRVSYVTEQRRAERPPGHLLGLPGDEWGRYVPGEAWILGGSEPVGRASPGRRHWAEVLVGDGGMDAFRRMDARAALRGWRIVGADDLRRVGEHARWRSAWGVEGPSLAAVAELVDRERRRPGGPRAGAVGDALGRAVAAAGDPEGAVELLVGLDEPDRESAVRGAVRALREAGAAGLGGRLRVAATERLGGRSGPLVDGLRRMVDRESLALRGLLGRDGGPEALVRGAFRGAAAGDPVARELVRLGAAAGRWTEEVGARLAGALPVHAEGADAAAADLLLALVREGSPAREVEAVAVPLLDRLEPAAVAALAPGLLDVDVEASETRRAAEALRHAAVMRAAAGGRELDDAVAALLRLGRHTASPSLDPAPWRALLGAATSIWLSRPAVLGALVEVLEAGARPLGDPAVGEDVRSLASLLARRVLERAGPGSLDGERATALLRLMWLEGDGSTAVWLAGTRPDAAPALLGRLLVEPAPLPLVPALRAALVEALETGADRRGLEPLAEELAAWAPALHERALRGTGGERFVPMAMAAGGDADRERAVPGGRDAADRVGVGPAGGGA